MLKNSKFENLKYYGPKKIQSKSLITPERNMLDPL